MCTRVTLVLHTFKYRSNGNPSWSMWVKPAIGRVDYHAAPQYAAWSALGEALNKSGRSIYYSICPHTNASSRGTAQNYSFDLFKNPIYAPPTSWTADERHKLANSILVEYMNTIDDWYKPDVDKKGNGDWGILTNIDSMVEATQFNYSVPGSWNDAVGLPSCQKQSHNIVSRAPFRIIVGYFLTETYG